MAKPLDGRKRDEWRARLEQFEVSGLTTAQFCRRENIAPHTFYYWDKRLGHKAKRARNKSKRRAVSSERDALATSVDTISAVENSSLNETLVHFTWNSKLSFSVPTDCLDTIRCVLQYASLANSESEGFTSAVGGFRQVTIG